MKHTHWIALAGLIGLLTSGVALAQTPEIPSCLSAPTPRLRRDYQAVVVPGTPPVNLRDEPTFRSNRVGTLTSGTPYRVINGPACAEAVIWWKVSTDDGLSGWAAEGQNGAYFLMPYQPEPLATAQTGQVDIRHKGVYFTLDSALAPAVSVQNLDEIWVNPEGEGFPEFAAPPGLRFTFFDGAEGSVFTRSALDTYPANHFARLYAPNGEKIEALKTLIANETASSDAEIPEVPGRNARQMIRASIKYLDLPEGGKGVRYLTYYAQNRYAATNELLYYEFRGFSSGGFNYIHLQYAVRASVLPETITGGAYWSEEDFETYSANVTQLLTALPADQFSPNLDLLDALARSIKVGNG